MRVRLWEIELRGALSARFWEGKAPTELMLTRAARRERRSGFDCVYSPQFIYTSYFPTTRGAFTGKLSPIHKV